MSVVRVCAGEDPVWSPIEITTDDGKSVAFHRGTVKQLALLSAEELVQASHLLSESRRGTCWASHPRFDGAISAFKRYCANKGITVFIR